MSLKLLEECRVHSVIGALALVTLFYFFEV